MTIKLQTATPFLFIDICEVIRLFWPEAQISETEGDVLMVHEHAEVSGQLIEKWSMDGVTQTHCAVAAHGRVGRYGDLLAKRHVKRAVKTGCFLLMREVTGKQPPWGSLTGIRPTRLLYEAYEAGMSQREAEKWLEEDFFVSEDRTRLLSQILSMQRGLIYPEKAQFDLYIGIPFCVTRCAYCSFSSGTLGDGRLTEPYIAALMREIDGCAEMTKRMGLRVRAAYMGGGTPTSLSADQLGRVLDRAMARFPGAVEWTVEAGRPDTIDREKLAALCARGVGRISVNPQTFSDETLKVIGRAHTSEDTRRAYALAREMGFADINMDLIAALPGETMGDFERTLSEAVRLAPESVTVHSLAIKRSSKLHELGYRQPDTEQAQQMVDLARGYLMAAGYNPYYLYRQKYMAGNLENVGYAKPGRACLYNIGNMEETAKVLALGAGAITKWLFPAERRIERAANVKNIEAYIERVDEMLTRKRALLIREDEEK
ncbi:MAG: coproporphyrinogen dehydrogenase HemZ [Clostridia bacterium]